MHSGKRLINASSNKKIAFHLQSKYLNSVGTINYIGAVTLSKNIGTEAKFKTPADQEGKHISHLGFGWREINYCTLAFTKRVLLKASEVFVTKQREEILLNSTEHISDQFHVMSIFQQDERFPVS